MSTIPDTLRLEAEIQRLRGLVESAARELFLTGYAAASDMATPHDWEVDRAWDESDAKKALGSLGSGAGVWLVEMLKAGLRQRLEDNP